ncbi:MAG: hypothetical protein HC806_09105 [Anaerolineae bacterium]|nr:hypothetical protein [Anaerolineae bacterium]
MGSNLGRAIDGRVGMAEFEGAFDRLWLVAPPEFEETAIPALLSNARWEFAPRRKLSLEYPAGQGEETLSQMGFSPEQTLIWMEYQA